MRTTGLGLCSAFHRFAPALGHWSVALVFSFSFHQLMTAFAFIYLAAFLTTLLLPYDTKAHGLGQYYYESAGVLLQLTILLSFLSSEHQREATQHTDSSKIE